MFKIDPGSINWLAVGAAALAAFFLGAIWYTALFGKAWAKQHGYSPEQLKAMQAKRPMPVFFGGLIVCYAAGAAAMAVLAQACGVTTAGGGLVLGLIAWVVVAGYAMTGHLSSPRPIGAYAIDAGFALVFLPVMGVIVSVWQ